MEIVEKWIKKEGNVFIKHLNTVYAWPELFENEFSFLLEKLRVVYSGILVGELVRDKLVPEHALAMSNSVADSIENIELTKQEAIKYLQRKDLQLHTATKGWQLASYSGHPLGWLNVLANRVNNYYPKELRILKDI